MSYTFDGANRVVSLSLGTVSFSIRDLWSRYVDWYIGDNTRYLPMATYIGADDIDILEGTVIPVYMYLENGWRIRPQEANHTVIVQDGILLVAGGGDPFTDTLGNFRVNTRYQQPVQAVSFIQDSGSGLTTGQAAQLDLIHTQVSLIESGLTHQQAMRILLAAAAGKVSGADTSQVVFRDMADALDRIIADVDGDGNRSSVTVDVS